MKETKRKDIVLLGSTGSIGTQTLDVINRYPERFKVKALTCGSNVERLMDQIAAFPEGERPEFAVCGTKSGADKVKAGFPGIKTSYGEEGLIEAAEMGSDLVVNALMGMRGLVPTVHALKKGRGLALANKETLVAGGHIVMPLARKKGIKILPIDSEHSAIFQCIQGSGNKKIKKILLTASGGPFRGWSKEELRDVTPEMALKHPNWSMGKKITIDSATMMNKGLEIIEARWLFDVSTDDIEVVVHPKSVVHSAVEFEDTSVLAQLGNPDMRVPISVALGYPERLGLEIDELDIFGNASELTFEKPDEKVFGLMDVAREADKAGGSAPVCMNAANEVLVQAFLDGEIGFTDIEDGIKKALSEHDVVKDPDLEETIEIDKEVRERVRSAIGE